MMTELFLFIQFVIEPQKWLSSKKTSFEQAGCDRKVATLTKNFRVHFLSGRCWTREQKRRPRLRHDAADFTLAIGILSMTKFVTL
jgi:hypothetical protein